MQVRTRHSSVTSVKNWLWMFRSVGRQTLAGKKTGQQWTMRQKDKVFSILHASALRKYEMVWGRQSKVLYLKDPLNLFFVAKARTIPRLVLMTVTLVQVSKILTWCWHSIIIYRAPLSWLVLFTLLSWCCRALPGSYHCPAEYEDIYDILRLIYRTEYPIYVCSVTVMS